MLLVVILVNQCSKKEIREKASKIVDLEEDVDDLMYAKDMGMLAQGKEEVLQSKMKKIDLLKNEIESCGIG